MTTITIDNEMINELVVVRHFKNADCEISHPFSL